MNAELLLNQAIEALHRVIGEIDEQAGEKDAEQPDQGMQCARYILDSEAVAFARRVIQMWEVS